MYDMSMFLSVMPCIKYNISKSLLRDTMYLTSKVAWQASGVHPQARLRGGVAAMEKGASEDFYTLTSLISRQKRGAQRLGVFAIAGIEQQEEVRYCHGIERSWRQSPLYAPAEMCQDSY